MELPIGDDRARPASSPAAWLHAFDRTPGQGCTPAARRLAEQYAARATQRGDGRWVVMIGDHRARRSFRRLDDLDVMTIACTRATVISRGEADALVAAGVVRAEIQPLYDPAVDCSEFGAVRVREALEYLAELGHAAVRFREAAAFPRGPYIASGVIAVPIPGTPKHPE